MRDRELDPEALFDMLLVEQRARDAETFVEFERRLVLMALRGLATDRGPDDTAEWAQWFVGQLQRAASILRRAFSADELSRLRTLSKVAEFVFGLILESVGGREIEASNVAKIERLRAERIELERIWPELVSALPPSRFDVLSDVEFEQELRKIDKRLEAQSGGRHRDARYLTPAKKRALASYQWALDRAPELETATRRQVWTYISKNGCPAYAPPLRVPEIRTWDRYLRAALRSGVPKLTSRTGREHGSSIVRESDI